MSTYTDTSGDFYLPRLAACSLRFDVRQSNDDGAEPDEDVVGKTFVLRIAPSETEAVVLSKQITAESSTLIFEFDKTEVVVEAADYIGTVWEEPVHKPLHPINIVIPVRNVVGGNS